MSGVRFPLGPTFLGISSVGLEVYLNTKSIGEKSEAVALATFLLKGWTVLQPFGDNQRYDLVIDRGNGFERIQVKTGKITKKKDCLFFHTCSSSVHRKNGTRRDYKGQCDYFVIYSPELNKVYMISVNEVGEAGCSLRLSSPGHKNGEIIRFAKDYEL